MFFLAIICDNITVTVTGTNFTTTTKHIPVPNGIRKDVNRQNTTTTIAPTNINVTEAIVNDIKRKAVFNDTKEKDVMRNNNNNNPKLYSNVPVVLNTTFVTSSAGSTVKLSSSTDKPNALKIANELQLLEKLTAVLPDVLDEKMNSNQNSANETAKKDLEVFEQFSLSHYLDPEAEVVVFRKNERSQRQISDLPPQKHILDNNNNKTETHIFKLVPQIKNFDTDNNADKTAPTVYDRNRMLISDAPPQFRSLDNDNISRKLILDMPKPDFNPILHISQCNSCIASVNKMNWNMPEPFSTANNQQFDIIQPYPLQIHNTDMFKSQNSFDNDKGTYLYLSPTLDNPHILQEYRRMDHINQNFRTSDDNPPLHYEMEKKLESKNKNVIESKVGADNTISFDMLNNPYSKLNLVHPTPGSDLNNKYPWLIGSSPLHSALRSQPLPAMHSLLMLNEPESNSDLKYATPAPVGSPTKFSQLPTNKDKFEYYDTLINIISNKNKISNNNKHRGKEPVNAMFETANEKLLLEMNEFKQNFVKLKPQHLVGGLGRLEVESQLPSDKKIDLPIQYLKMADTGTQSNKISHASESIIDNEAEVTARKRNSSANSNQLFRTQSAMDNKKPESNKHVVTEEIDTAKRRALDSKTGRNIQKDLTVPLDMLVIQLLRANGFDTEKIDQFWPHLVALLANHIPYLPKSVPYYPPRQVPNDSLKVQNINIPNLSVIENIRNVEPKDLPILNVISNVTDRQHITQSHEGKLNNETTTTVKYNVTDSIQNTIQSLLSSHNVTNNSDTISISTTIFLDVTDNDTNLDPKDIRRHLEIIKIENNANNASVLLLNKRNYDEILKSLDSFTLERKKAYVTVVPTENTREYLDMGRSKYNRTVDPTFLDKVFGNKYTPEKQVTIGPAKEELLNSKDFLDNPQVFSALKKQTELMGKLLLKLRGESARKNAGKDFQDLIKQVEAKKHGTYTTEIIEDLNKRIGDDTKTPPTTVMTMIDETEVRKALRNSPYVKRILKLSKMKRDKYYQGKKTAERKKY